MLLVLYISQYVKKIKWVIPKKIPTPTTEEIYVVRGGELCKAKKKNMCVSYFIL